MSLNKNTETKLNTGKKLGDRLSTIDQVIWSEYTHIWDCCCDHGLLGMRLLDRNAAPHIHFVDVSQKLIEQLKHKLQTHQTTSPIESKWYAHCLDAATIDISALNGKHLFVIAGVGGDLTSDIVSALIRGIDGGPSKLEVDFLLCPIRHHYTLRRALRRLGCNLKREVLVEENRRIYEVVLVSYQAENGSRKYGDNDKVLDFEGATCASAARDNYLLDNRTAQESDSLRPISETGEDIWCPVDMRQKEIACRYLHSLIQHYARMAESGSEDALQKLKAYQRIAIHERY